MLMVHYSCTTNASGRHVSDKRRAVQDISRKLYRSFKQREIGTLKEPRTVLMSSMSLFLTSH